MASGVDLVVISAYISTDMTDGVGFDVSGLYNILCRRFDFRRFSLRYSSRKPCSRRAFLMRRNVASSRQPILCRWMPLVSTDRG